MTYFADRVWETTTSTGTSTITTSGTSPTGYRTFAAGLGAVTQQVSYCISDPATGAWEVGKGSFNGATTLTRDLVRSSSNAGALVSFAAGTKDVMLVATSEHIDNAGIGLQYAQQRNWAMP
jgi:hypothetical protein